MRIKEQKIHHSETSYANARKDILAFSQHKHTEYELIIVDKGKAKACISGTLTNIKATDIIFIAPMLSHSYHYSKEELPAEGRILLFSPEILSEQLLSLSASGALQRLVEYSSSGIIFSSTHLYEKAGKTINEITQAGGVEQLSLIYKLLSELCKEKKYKQLSHLTQSEPETETMRHNDGIENANIYIRQNFAERITLSELSSIAGLSQCAFCRAYKRRTHLTPFEFLANVRITNAGKLLTVSSKTIAEIAYDCGYRHISQFNKQFLRIMGVSPSQYIKIVKE